MTKVYCAKSGLAFNCDHFKLTIEPGKHLTHPIFYADKSYLLSQSARFFSQQLTPTESYLLYLALLDSTELVTWHTNAAYNTRTTAIIASNMESLVNVIGKIDFIKHPSLQLPRISLSRDTADLSASGTWIASWNRGIVDWLQGNKRQDRNRAIVEREKVLQRLINNPNANQIKKAYYVAAWAADAAEFPDTKIHGTEETISQYWQRLIRLCVTDKITEYPSAHLWEVYNHIISECDLNRDTIYYNLVCNYLKIGIDKITRFSKLGDIYLSLSPVWTDIEDDTSVETQNFISVMATAPQVEPRREDFAADKKGQFEYLRAMNKYRIAQQMK